MMQFENIGGVNLFRPHASSELVIRHEAEASVADAYGQGKYANRGVINAILHSLFAFYDSKLKEALEQVASRDFMEFVLDQYDRSATIDARFKRGELSPADNTRWSTLGPVFRRACKYVAECTCMIATDVPITGDEQTILESTDQCWICAELMVQYAMLSDQTFHLFPDDTTLELWPADQNDWIVLSVADASRYEAFQERIRQDTASRSAYIDESKGIYSRQRILEHLDEVFRADCGFALTDALGFIQSLNTHAIQRGNGFDVPFVSKTQILSCLTADYGLSTQHADTLLDGVCLQSEKMRTEGRVVWRPKQEYRAFARPFFEFPHPSGTHLVWSREMAKECWAMLFTRLAQKQIPPEWRSDNTAHAIEGYVSSITRAFEDTVNLQLCKAGVSARRYKSSSGSGSGNPLVIPGSIGEIDTLGFWAEQGLLIVGEVKLVKSATEPATFRDDIDKFIKKGNNYVEQLKRKTKWALENMERIGQSLSAEKGFPEPVVIRKVAPVLITYYPSFVSYFIDDVPCVSLCELLQIVGSTNLWPFKPVYEV